MLVKLLELATVYLWKIYGVTLVAGLVWLVAVLVLIVLAVVVGLVVIPVPVPVVVVALDVVDRGPADVTTAADVAKGE